VIAQLSEHLFLMQRSLMIWTNPLQSSDVNRDEQRREASEAFDKLIAYYRSNSIWLDRRICDKMDSLISTTYDSAYAYADELNERGYLQDKVGRGLHFR
jgi:hypothetical protein